MDTFACDTSYYQAAYSDSYNHPWAIFRVCDGTFVDPKFDGNRAWAEKAVGRKITGYTAYCVFRPGVDVLAVVKSAVGAPGKHLTVMVDVESWGGEIVGDHSAAITALVNGLGAWLGDKRRVLAYGNQGDLASIYPHRPAGLKLVVASYGSTKPTVPGLIGWQYSDGSGRWPVPTGYPTSSPPFGHCDHNVFPGLSSAQLASALGVGGTPTGKDWFDMASKEDLRAVVREEIDRGVPGPSGNLWSFYDLAAATRLKLRSIRRAADKRKAAKK